MLAICAAALMASCSDETEYGGFEETSGTATESSGQHAITIDLGMTTSASTTISYRVGGSAALDADYRLTSSMNYYSDALSVTVPAGESTATIDFEIIDDEQVERFDEVVYFEITAISDASIADNFRETTYVFEIEDDDDAPENALQVDLAWNLGDGVRINASDFDLYLADTIEVDGEGLVTRYHVVDQIQSTRREGFESITIPHALPDRPYYIVIEYVSGENTAELLLQFNATNVQRSAMGWVSSESLGRALYYGPVTKSGSSYVFR